jgi:hypothetical protein
MYRRAWGFDSPSGYHATVAESVDAAALEAAAFEACGFESHPLHQLHGLATRNGVNPRECCGKKFVESGRGDRKDRWTSNCLPRVGPASRLVFAFRRARGLSLPCKILKFPPLNLVVGRERALWRP